jgi:peptidoglycan-associated lipoprotein
LCDIGLDLKISSKVPIIREEYFMTRGNRFIFVLAILCMIVLIGGCAKKPVEQTKEVSQPTQVTPEQPKVEAPTPEAEPQVQKGPLAQQIADFENNDVHFDFDKFDLTPEARKILADKAAFLNGHPNMKIRIEGNCDERGTTEYNLALGDRRAKSSMDYLVFLGITSDRITTVSYGKEKPLDPGNNEEAWAKNRRDHFVILNK